MIVDTSAILAVVYDEPESDSFLDAIALCKQPVRISAASYVECGTVVDRHANAKLGERLDKFLATSRILIEPVTPSQAQIARQAYKDFGKGSGHPARLNFGDCFAYALAKEKSEPLLFKGRDFSETDVRGAATEP